MKLLVVLICVAFATLAWAVTPIRAVIDCGTLSGYGLVEIYLPNDELRVVKISCWVRT